MRNLPLASVMPEPSGSSCSQSASKALTRMPGIGWRLASHVVSSPLIVQAPNMPLIPHQ